MTTLSIRRFKSPGALDAALEARLAQAIGIPVPSAIMLSGGTTPLPAYRALGRRRLPHDPGLRILFSDDRYVPADSEKSNYHQSRPLLDALGLAPEAVLRVRTELALEEAAVAYASALAALLSGGTPVTLGLLGLGADGHTASLFRTDDIERGRGKFAIHVQRPDGMSGVSVTPDFLAEVGELLFVVVAGGGKSAALAALMARDPGLTAWRAVQGRREVGLWVCEEA